MVVFECTQCLLGPSHSLAVKRVPVRVLIPTRGDIPTHLAAHGVSTIMDASMLGAKHQESSD